MEKIGQQNLSEQVFARVQRDIMNGVLRPDEPIRQDALAETLGVSKIPVREALTRLAQIGFVVAHPRRGYCVQGLSPREAEEIFALRLALEPKAAAVASVAADATERNRAKTCLEALNKEVRISGPDAGALNRDFHQALVAPAGRPLTLQMVMQLHALSERYVNLHLQPEGRGARAESEHRGLLRAWTLARAADVERLLELHIRRTLEDLLAEMSSNSH